MLKRIALLSALAVLPSAARSAPAGQKTIKDPAEYDAYMAAYNAAAPADKAAAMDAFLDKYPASVVREDALEQAMASYQAAGAVEKVAEEAGRLLKERPGNVRALAVAVYLGRTKAAGGDPEASKSLGANANRGIESVETWEKPDGLSDADFGRLRDQMRVIFQGAAGFAALQAKDWSAARGHLLKAVALDPSDLQNAYQLGIAELESTPLQADGFWRVARAMQLAGGNAAGRASIEAYGKAKYKRYHGGEDGWDELVKNAAAQAEPPTGFAKSVAKALTPAQIAVKAVKDNDPATLSVGDWEFVLGLRDASPANKEAARKVWAAILAKQKGGKAVIRFPGAKVISAAKTAVDLALTDENQQSGTADLVATPSKPLDEAPAVGSTVTVTGVFSGYVPKPFRFEMRRAVFTK